MTKRPTVAQWNVIVRAQAEVRTGRVFAKSKNQELALRAMTRLGFWDEIMQRREKLAGMTADMHTTIR